MWSATQTPTEPLGSAINANIGQIANQYGQQFNGGNLPSYGINPNQSYTDAIMARLQPQQQMQQKQFDAQMANQGIPVGSEAYQNAARQFQQGQNDQRTSAVVGGMQTGLQANQQQYNQNLANYQLPLTVGSQLKALGTPNYINPASQQTTAGADALSAGIGSYNANMGQYNARQAANQNMTSGLFGLAGAGLMSPAGTFSGLGSLFGGSPADAGNGASIFAGGGLV